MSKQTLLFLLLAIVLPEKSLASPLSDDDCFVEGVFDFLAGAKAGMVVGETNEHVNFKFPYDQCRIESPRPNCKRTPYVISGDTIAVFYQTDSSYCVGFGTKDSTTIGLLPKNRVKLADKRDTPEKSDWLGTWSNKAGSLEISRNGEEPTVHILGQTEKEFGNAAEPPYTIHIGDLDAVVTPSENRLEIPAEDEYACTATIYLVGPYLAVHDNYRCGGAGVSFDGLYRKLKK